MARKKKSPAKKQPQNDSIELRSAEVVTVAWTMCTLTTLLCLLGGLVAEALGWLTDSSSATKLLGRFLLVSGCVSGLTGIAMLPVVLKLRRQPVPRQVIWVSAWISAIPIVVLAVILVLP